MAKSLTTLWILLMFIHKHLLLELIGKDGLGTLICMITFL